MTGSGGRGGSRWDELDADLDAQHDAALVAERRAQAAEAGRAELASVQLVDRLRAGLGREVVVTARGCGPVRGVVAGVGRDWLRVVDGGRETVLVLVAVLSVGGLGAHAVSPRLTPLVESRWGLAGVLRRFARDRAPVRVVLDSGDVVSGTIDAVGADHLELAEHAVGQARRRGSVVDRRVVPFAALAAVSRGGAV